jgi:hypothetical protein
MSRSLLSFMKKRKDYPLGLSADTATADNMNDNRCISAGLRCSHNSFDVINGLSCRESVRKLVHPGADILAWEPLGEKTALNVHLCNAS